MYLKELAFFSKIFELKGAIKSLKDLRMSERSKLTKLRNFVKPRIRKASLVCSGIVEATYQRTILPIISINNKLGPSG